jgi:hypothetical protein
VCAGFHLFLQGFAQNFSSNYSVQLRAFLLSPELQRNLRIFFADPDGGAGTLLMEAAGIRLNISALTVEEWRIRLQNYFQGNFRYSAPRLLKFKVCISTARFFILALTKVKKINATFLVGKIWYTFFFCVIMFKMIWTW